MLFSKIKYPDTLVAMWNYVHGNASILSDDKWEKNYNILQKKLRMFFRQKLQNIPGMNNENFNDIANDFLVELFKVGSVCPSFITSSSVLFAQAAKFTAKKNNPAQYELHAILYNTLRKLEKNKKICRDKKSQKHRITQMTYFALPDTPADKKAEIDNYRNKKNTIPFYTTKLRNNNSEKSKIITPKDAEELVFKLMEAFDGWVPTNMLFNAMQNHVLEQLEIVHLQPMEDDDKDPILNFAAPDEDIVVDEFQKMQMQHIIVSTCNKIWTRISEVSVKVFCLYYVPGYYGQKVSMKDIGSTSTVSDQNKKIDSIIREEIKNYANAEDLNPSDKELTFCLKNIFRNLNKKCTESGYNVNLCNSGT